MAQLTATLDSRDARRVIFDRPVTLDEARAFLWKSAQAPDALRSDPAEFAVRGRQRVFHIRKEDSIGLMLGLQHGLASEVLRRLHTPMGPDGGPGFIASSGPPAELPKWLPLPYQQTIRSGSLPYGVTRLAGIHPWGDVVVWKNNASIQVYQEYPDDIEFYLDVAKGDGRRARLLQQVFTMYNADMRHFVEDKHMPPDMARDELRRINEELLKLVLEAAMNILTTGAAISAMGSSVRASADNAVQAAERTNFASPKSSTAIEEIKLTQAQYREALQRVFPSHQLDSIARTIDDVGRRAAERVADDPAFLKALMKKDWLKAGNMFHDAAKQEARAVNPATLPTGWRLTAEETIQAGKGGSRIDLLLRGPNGEVIEIDWKTTGFSALSSSARKELAKHLGDIWLNIGGQTIQQESRSWVDYVRMYFPNYNWGLKSTKRATSDMRPGAAAAKPTTQSAQPPRTVTVTPLR